MRIRILKPMEGRLGEYDLRIFTPMLVYDVKYELGEQLIEMGTAIPDKTTAPAVMLQEGARKP